MGIPAWISGFGVGHVLRGLAYRRLILRQLVNQDGNILFMSTIGLTFIIIGAPVDFWWRA